MQNRPTKRRFPFRERNHTQIEPKDDHGGKRKPFSAFLIDTGFWPLAFAGKCMQQFGFGAVAGFVLGAALLYGYSVFRILPGSRVAAIERPAPIPTPVPPKTVVLHGTVRSHETQFEIGVLAIRRGPFQPDGSYSVEVPESDRYLVIGWYPDYSKFKMQDMSPDKSGTLQELVFPTTPMARQEGTVNNQRDRASDKFSLAVNRKSRVKDAGINMKNALLERSK